MKLNICLDGIRFLGGMALMFQWPLGGFWKLKPMKKKKEKSIRYIYIYMYRMYAIEAVVLKLYEVCT